MRIVIEFIPIGSFEFLGIVYSWRNEFIPFNIGNTSDKILPTTHHTD